MILPTSALPVNAILSTSGVLDDRRAGRLADAGDDVDDARRQAGLGEARGEREHGQRRLLGRLEHDRAAGADRRRELPRRHQQRVVPRDDLAGDADRLAQREAHRVVGHRQDVAVNLRRQAAVVLEAGRDVGDVELGLDDRLAAVARLELGQLVGAVADDLRELEEDAAAVLRRRVLPRTLVERGARGVHGAIDVGGRRVGHARDDLGRRRIDDVDRGGRLRRDEFAVDVKLVGLHGREGKPQLYQLTGPRLLVAR